jgi:hypothetical protein
MKRALLLLATLGCTSKSPVVVDHVEDLGAFPAPPTVVGRDGTSSALVGDRILWTFGDTFLTQKTALDGTSVRSSTAGWSSPDAALALTEPVDDAGLPFQLVPYTAAEITQNQTDPLNGVALWPGPVIATSATDAVVLFQHVLRQGGSGFTTDAIGAAHVTKDSTVATRDATFLFQSPDPLFGNGGFTVENGSVYLFDCEGSRCKVARAPVASVTDRSAFEFWDGSAYQSDVTKAAWFIDGASYALSIEFNAFLGRYLAVYSKPLSNDVALRTATHLEGPWTDAEVIVPGTTPGLVTSDAGVNYLAHEHAELRSPDGRTITIGYAHPLPNFGGACRLARIVLR